MEERKTLRELQSDTSVIFLHALKINIVISIIVRTIWKMYG